MATRDLTQREIDVLPIDIHYNKLLDWLINRRHCKQQWPADSLQIREKINAAIEDMPAVSEITSMLEGTYINYFHCQEIIKLLKETESGKKNIFGQYSSQKLKDWLDIIKKYEADGVYLAEGAQVLMRNVNYEIPALKKQIAKCQQIQRECTRKESDYAVNAGELRKKYESKCNQMGIEGKKIKFELLSLVADLPTVFEKIALQTKTLQSAITFYDDFINFTMKRDNIQCESLTMLKFLEQRGNATTYEWREGSAPSRIEASGTAVDAANGSESGTVDEDIDWGDINVDAAVDFGEEIDFGDANITIEGGGDALITEEEETLAQSDPVTVVPDNFNGAAIGDDALTALDNPKLRNLFLDDLYELDAFLSQRLSEMQGEGNVLSSSLFQSAPTSLQVDEKNVEAMATRIRDVIGQLSSVKMQHLLLIRNSPRYVDRVRDSLRQILQLADKMVFYEKEMVVKRETALEEQRQLEPKLDVIIDKSRQLQKQMENEISIKYKKRPVNIMGEINTI